MKIDATLLSILKNFASINQSVIFKPGNIQTTMSPAKTIMARADIGQEIDRKFAIYDLSRFLGVLGLFKNPEIELTDNSLIVSSGAHRINYMYASEETIKAPPDKLIKLPSVDVSLTITALTLITVQKAMGALTLPEFSIVGDGQNMYVTAWDSKNSSTDVYRVDIGQTDKKFAMIFKGENMRLLPLDYDVQICSKGISYWHNDSISYWIAVEGNSKFES